MKGMGLKLRDIVSLSYGGMTRWDLQVIFGEGFYS